MTALSIFGICIAIAIVFVLIVLAVLGSNSVMLLIIFPALIAEQITGENLYRNTKSILYTILMFLGVLIEVLLLAGIFFGIYCLFWGWPVAVASHVNTLSFSSNQLILLQVINEVLLVIESYFVIMFLYHLIKNKESFSKIKGIHFFQYRILPLISYPLAFFFLFNCYTFLGSAPNGSSIGALLKIAGYVYLLYILYSIYKTAMNNYYLYRNRDSTLKTLELKYWVNLSLQILYYGLFMYLFFQLSPVWR